MAEEMKQDILAKVNDPKDIRLLSLAELNRLAEEIRERIRRIPGVTDACIMPLPMNHAHQAQIAALVATDLAAREIRAAIRK